MTLSQSLSAEKMVAHEVKQTTAQGWLVGIDIGTTTTLYITKSEAVELFAVLAAALKGETK